MATTGPKAPTEAITASISPWSDNDWVNPANIYGAGEAEVSAATFDAGDQTYVLEAFTFDFSAIPDGATIDGVQVVINARYATVVVSLDYAKLLDTSRIPTGTNQYATPEALTTSAANYTKGGATDKWGAALTAAWVKNANFGVGVGCLAGGSGNSNNDVYIDSVTMEVWYTAPATAYTLAAAAGSFSETGTAVALKATRVLSAAAGSFAMVGQDATLVRGYSLIAAAGEFSLSGTAAGLLAARKLVAASGAFSWGGQDVTLLYTPSGAAYVLTADGGVFSLTGTAAGLLKASSLTAEEAVYYLSGVNVLMIYAVNQSTLTNHPVIPAMPTMPTIRRAL